MFISYQITLERSGVPRYTVSWFRLQVVPFETLVTDKQLLIAKEMLEMRVSIVMALGLSLAPMMMAKDADERLNSAADVLTDMMHASDKGIPQDLINKAQCVVVVPGMKKGAFIVGAKYGRGFVMCRRTSGMGWSAPASIRVEGGSVGFQIGGSEQDVILLVMNHSGMNKLLSDQFTLGGEGTVSAGPLGRDAEAQTDAMMHAEMLSYSRSRGIFAGISLQGATLRQDTDANSELYGRKLSNREILAGDVKTPAAAASLEAMLDKTSMHKEH